MIRIKRLTIALTTLAAVCSTPSAFACPGAGGRHRAAAHRSVPAYAPLVHTPRVVTPPTVVPALPAPTPVRPAPAPPMASAPASPAVPKPKTPAAPTVPELVASAKSAFASRNYGTALEGADRLVTAVPRNAEALQFRSLVKFALADYEAAAADVREALKFGPVLGKGSIEQLYGDRDRYASHRKSLEAAVAADPESADLHFLLAYQSLATGDLAGGEVELEAVLGIKPEEKLAGTLLEAVHTARRREATTVAVDRR